MNWEAISAISETLGAIGVIASLIYLGSQLRSNAVASAVEAKLTTTRFLTDFNRDLIKDPELYDRWERGAKNLESLERNEFVRFSNLNLNAFWFFSAGHYQKRVGKLDDGEWNAPRFGATLQLRRRDDVSSCHVSLLRYVSSCATLGKNAISVIA